MLDTATKRRIDTARDILVGKVPDPKSQVEQITIALIYKFMDDMDAESEELGGKRKFFAGEFAQYGWPRLVRSGLGGYEILNLYAEAITRMPENPGIPPLFRDIFKNAFLPYRDPETLRAFLKVIDEFEYDHSERLGDAFEYLLSVLGSQGDAGQFRTPRHIIDFIVSIVDPKKDETILDPACGTAGFLISSYKHILKANIDEQDGQDKEKAGNSGEKADSSLAPTTLTPDEKGRLADNFKGYDISPDMVRLSLVNLYLHGFVAPQIHEYDTLTSEDHWNEYADVILANPPFMSPKGGIRPHNRFSVKSKRSEVLFVDYMAEHLTPNGRAGIIVPEGIIFQSQNAYKQLRNMLVEEYLVAVVSLPAGVFNPYSGVKTSILILDKALARRRDSIGFFKVENDGFDLGAQRRAIAENDLPEIEWAVREYVSVNGEDEQEGDASASVLNKLIEKGSVQIVAKEKIAENGEYNLRGERYRINTQPSKYFQIRLSEVCEINPQVGNPAMLYPDSYFNYIDISCVENESGKFLGGNKIETHKAPSRARRLIAPYDVLISTVRPNLRAFTLLPEIPERAVASTGFAVLRSKKERLLPEFLIYMLRHDNSVRQMVQMMGKGSYPSINQADVESIEIPLPPLEVQREIVAEIEGYQKVIDGARAVVENYRPHITIDPDWPTKELSEVAIRITDGTHRTPNYTESGVPFLRVTDITKSNGSKKFISEEEHMELIKRCHPQKGDVLYSKNGTIGVATVVDWEGDFSIFVSLALIRPRRELVDSRYLEYFLNSDIAYKQATSRSKSGTVTNLHLVDIKTMQIPLPSLTKQQHIVTEIEAEQALITANRELIERFEKKIQAAIARFWSN